MSGNEVAFYPDALKDVKRLDGSQRKNVLKAIEKIRESERIHCRRTKADSVNPLETRPVQI